MPAFESPQEAVQSGEVYIKNAEDALNQKVIREDQLYIWENQLQAIDEFLADTEDLDGGDPLLDIRGQARDAKGRLERSIADFFDEPVEDEDPANNAIALLEVGAGIIEEAEQALKKDAGKIEDAAFLEDPLLAVKQWLADTEPLAGNEVMAQARADMKQVKADLETRLEKLIEQWKAAETGDDGDE